jgi:proton-dependent oligopeptide transporter, POT family
LSAKATESTLASPTPDLPDTAFERRLGHPPGLVVLFFVGMWERFSFYGVRGLLKLYMVNYLFVTLRQTVQGGSYVERGDPGAVVGWRFIQDLLPAAEPATLQRCIDESLPRLLAGNASTHMAPLGAEAAQLVAEQTCAAAPQASMAYGLFVGFLYLSPLLGGVLADRYLGRKKAVIVGCALLLCGYFFLSFDSLFFLALLLVILGTGAFTPSIYTRVGDLYSRTDPRRDGAFTLFYAGITFGALICNGVCGTLAVVYGWHQAFAAAAMGMGIGFVIYLGGQRYLPGDAPEPAAAPAVDKPAPSPTSAWVLVALFLINVVFWTVHEQHDRIMQSWAEEQRSWTLVLGLSPLGILLFAPLLDVFWRRQIRKGTSSTSASKMAMGWILLGLSFLVMFIGVGQGSVLRPLLCVVLLTAAELYFAPIALSLLSKLSPVRMAATLMALWLMPAFLGNVLSGFLGVLAAQWSNEGFFLLLAVLGIGLGATMLTCRKPLKRATGIDL